MDQEKLDTCDKTTNFKYRCKMCSTHCHTDVLTKFAHTYDEEDSGQFKTIMGFTCRGFVPISFQFLNGWQAKSSASKQLFENIDFSKQQVGKEEFFEVDNLSNSCSITEIKTQFIHTK
ncbi:hypothetical protein Ciccas_003793 [Cichlidogyrus casuarinus]|uniref:Uncharacterized protein n=1 Tax=Cichlidogyrus casuarinus TaxID=1844966 RepID=A0ABD2QDD8_9PLAT